MNELQPQKYNDACLDSGQLVSLRDGELTPEETEQALAHLALCPDCASDERGMRAASQEVYDLLTVLDASPLEIPETKLAFSALQTRLDIQNRREKSHAAVPPAAHSKMSFFQVRKPQHPGRWWIVVAAAALIALIVLPNAGALANQFLSLFSVQQFQPVSIDPQSFRNGIGEDLQNFGDVNINPGNVDGIQNPTQSQVEKSLNFKLLLPGYLPPGVGHAMQFSLINSASGTFIFNAARARTYLAKTGQGNVVIPTQLDGATFTITLTPGVIINYGNQCQGQNQCSGGKQFFIGEIPSPVILATGKASLKDLRDFALSLPKLAPEARLLLQDVNLDSGVVPLPIPPQVQAQQIMTHGVQGVLMTDTSLSLGAVIWQTHGIIYAVAGATSSSAQLLECANSLQ
jgi:hypothetical protein